MIDNKKALKDMKDRMTGGLAYFSHKQNGLERTLIIYLAKLTPAQRQELKKAEEVLLSLAHEANERSERKLKG
jgi:hypothetical protein